MELGTERRGGGYIAFIVKFRPGVTIFGFLSNFNVILAIIKIKSIFECIDQSLDGLGMADTRCSKFTLIAIYPGAISLRIKFGFAAGIDLSLLGPETKGVILLCRCLGS